MLRSVDKGTLGGKAGGSLSTRGGTRAGASDFTPGTEGKEAVMCGGGGGGRGPVCVEAPCVIDVSASNSGVACGTGGACGSGGAAFSSGRYSSGTGGGGGPDGVGISMSSSNSSCLGTAGGAGGAGGTGGLNARMALGGVGALNGMVVFSQYQIPGSKLVLVGQIWGYLNQFHLTQMV